MSADDFARLFDVHHRQLIAVARRIVGPEAAEDVAQQAWANAWRNRAAFRGTCSPSTWLYRITVNTAITATRRTKHQRTEDPLDVAGDLTAPAESPEQIALHGQRLALVGAALRRLPLVQQTAYASVLRGTDYADTARTMRIPLGTLKSQLARGRRHLIALVAAHA